MRQCARLALSLFNATLDCMPKFIEFLKMSTYNEPKENTYYSITPLGYIGMPRKPLVQIDGHFRVLEAEIPELPDGMIFKVEFPTGTNNRNFYKDLEEMIFTMEHENEDFQKRTVLKRKVKIPNSDMLLEPGTFAQIWEKYGCGAYERKGENKLTKISYEDLVDKSFEGSCIVKVCDTYYDARETTFFQLKKLWLTTQLLRVILT